MDLIFSNWQVNKSFMLKFYWMCEWPDSSSCIVLHRLCSAWLTSAADYFRPSAKALRATKFRIPKKGRRKVYHRLMCSKLALRQLLENHGFYCLLPASWVNIACHKPAFTPLDHSCLWPGYSCPIWYSDLDGLFKTISIAPLHLGFLYFLKSICAPTKFIVNVRLM